MPWSKLEARRGLPPAKALKSLDDPALLQKDTWLAPTSTPRSRAAGKVPCWV